MSRTSAVLILFILISVSGLVEGSELWLTRMSSGTCIGVVGEDVTSTCLMDCIQQCHGLGCHSFSYTPSTYGCQLGWTEQTTDCAQMETITYLTHGIFELTTTTTTVSTTSTTTTSTSTTPATQAPGLLTAGITVMANSVASAGDADKTIDGASDLDDENEAFCTEEDNYGSFIRYDLGGDFTVTSIGIYTLASDSSTGEDIEVFVGTEDESLTDSCFSRDGAPTDSYESFDCTTPLQGRYVELRWQKEDVSQKNCLEEIEIMGYGVAVI